MAKRTRRLPWELCNYWLLPASDFTSSATCCGSFNSTENGPTPPENHTRTGHCTSWRRVMLVGRTVALVVMKPRAVNRVSSCLLTQHVDYENKTSSVSRTAKFQLADAGM